MFPIIAVAALVAMAAALDLFQSMAPFLGVVAVVAIVAMAALDLFETIAPFLGVVVPLIVAFAVRYQAKKTVKFVVTLVITAGVAVASIALEDWSMFTVALLIDRALMTLGEAQLVYFTVSQAVDRWTAMESINELPMFRPESGIG